MSSDGDWLCSACQHLNFKRRDTCQKCTYPKNGGMDVSSYKSKRTEVLAGDWYCSQPHCGAHNFASRPTCFRCGALKNDFVGGYGDGGGRPGWKTGDWVCTRWGCGEHNYAHRTECHKCKTPREHSSQV